MSRICTPVNVNLWQSDRCQFCSQFEGQTNIWPSGCTAHPWESYGSCTRLQRPQYHLTYQPVRHSANLHCGIFDTFQGDAVVQCDLFYNYLRENKVNYSSHFCWHKYFSVNQISPLIMRNIFRIHSVLRDILKIIYFTEDVQTTNNHH